MSNLIQVPESIEAAEANSNTFTGKLWFVSTQTGGNALGVSGGQNPGQYTISPNNAHCVESALTALTNKANVWGIIENGEVTVLSVYSA